MAAWMAAAIERCPPRVRRIVLVTPAVLLLGGAITALSLEAARSGGARRRTPLLARPSRPEPARPLPSSLGPPASATELDTAAAAAAAAASRFLLSYLRFAYGRASAGSLWAVTPKLRDQLSRVRAQVTPAERRRQPRVVLLRLVATTPRFVVATAAVNDGGIARYRLRVVLQEHASRWLVGSVRDG